MSESMPIEALREAIRLCGTAKALADKVRPLVAARNLTCSQQHVSNWLHRDGGVQPDYVLAVAEAVDWRVSPHRLRAALYPHPDDGLPASHRGKQQEAA